MVKNGIPVFTPSGAGLMVDLKNVKISEMIAWGGHKGQLGSKYESVAGTSIEVKDGENIEYFNYIDINEYAGLPDSDTYKLLEKFGLQEENLIELDNAWQEGNLETFQVRWTGDGKISQGSFDQWIAEIGGLLSIATELRVIGSPMRYNPSNYTSAQRLPKYTDDWNTTNTSASTVLDVDTADLDDFDTTPSKEEANPDRLTNVFSLQVFNGAVDITSSYSIEFRKAIVAIILMEGSNAFMRTSSVKSESTSGSYVYVDQVETFNPQINSIYMSNRYLDYTVDDPTSDDDDDRVVDKAVAGEEDEMFQYYSFYWAHFWDAKKITTTDDIYDLTDGLFILINETVDPLTGERRGQRMMTVDGLKKSTSGNFGFYVSEFMEIYTRTDKGNFLKRFVMGIINAFLSFVDAVLDLAEAIPVFGDLFTLIMDGIADLFGISYEQLRAFVKVIIMAIIVAVIIFYAPVLAGEVAGSAGGIITNVMTGVAAGAMTIPQLAFIGLELYSTLSSGLTAVVQTGIQEDKKAREAKKKEEMNVDSPTQKAFLGTMGTFQDYENSNDLMYNRMFNPLDSLVHGEMPQIPNQQKII